MLRFFWCSVESLCIFLNNIELICDVLNLEDTVKLFKINRGSVYDDEIVLNEFKFDCTKINLMKCIVSIEIWWSFLSSSLLHLNQIKFKPDLSSQAILTEMDIELRFSWIKLNWIRFTTDQMRRVGYYWRTRVAYQCANLFDQPVISCLWSILRMTSVTWHSTLFMQR